ncbi:hypothetical protein GCM10022236_39430 [Microlunatus ginsengisoli]|uniref:Uncharacterized protein n=1 Tax=Microlunatus ginsengisoli TaxID=363863 RepID=A0ABP7AIM1_9ACTN
MEMIMNLAEMTAQQNTAPRIRTSASESMASCFFLCGLRPRSGRSVVRVRFRAADRPCLPRFPPANAPLEVKVNHKIAAFTRSG